MLLSNLKRKAISSGFSEKALVQVAKELPLQIRYMPEMDSRANLLIEIPKIAKEYGTRFDISQNVLVESVRLIKSKFSDLSVNEIREAYRQFSINEIEAKGAETYGGEFNVTQLGKILSAYKKARRKKMFVVQNLMSQMREEGAKLEKGRLSRENFDKEFPKMMAEELPKMETWREIPSWWYEATIRLGILDFTKIEADETFQEAEDMVDLELEIEKSKELDAKINAESFVKKQLTREEFKKSIARKLIIFKKLK